MSAHSSYTSLFSSNSNSKSTKATQDNSSKIFDQLASRMTCEELKQLQSVINKDQNMRRREAHRVLQLKRQIVTQQRNTIQSVQRVPKRKDKTQNSSNIAEQFLNKGFHLVDKVNFRLGTEDLTKKVIKTEVCKICRKNFDRACEKKDCKTNLGSKTGSKNGSRIDILSGLTFNSKTSDSNNDNDDLLSISSNSSSCLDDFCPDCKFPVCQNCRIEIDIETKDKHLPAALCAVLGLTVSKDDKIKKSSTKKTQQLPSKGGGYRSMEHTGFDSSKINYEPRISLNKTSPQTLENYRDTLGSYRQGIKNFQEHSKIQKDLDTTSQHSFISEFSDLPSISEGSKYTSASQNNLPPWLCKVCFQKRQIKAKTGQWFVQSNRYEGIKKLEFNSPKKHVGRQKSCNEQHIEEEADKNTPEIYSKTLPKKFSTRNTPRVSTPKLHSPIKNTYFPKTVPSTLNLSQNNISTETSLSPKSNALQVHNKFALKAISLSQSSLNKSNANSASNSLRNSVNNLIINSNSNSVKNINCIENSGSNLKPCTISPPSPQAATLSQTSTTSSSSSPNSKTSSLQKSENHLSNKLSPKNSQKSTKNSRSSTQSVSIFEVPNQTTAIISSPKTSKLTLTKSQSFTNGMTQVSAKVSTAKVLSIASSSSTHLDNLNLEIKQEPKSNDTNPVRPKILDSMTKLSSDDIQEKDHLQAIPVNSTGSSMFTMRSSSAKSEVLRAPTAIPEVTPDNLRNNRNSDITSSNLSLFSGAVSTEFQPHHNEDVYRSAYQENYYRQNQCFQLMNPRSPIHNYSTSKTNNSWSKNNETSNIQLSLYQDKSTPINYPLHSVESTPAHTPKKAPKSPFRKVTKKVKKSLQAFKRKK